MKHCPIVLLLAITLAAPGLRAALSFEVANDHTNLVYRCGERASFVVSVTDGGRPATNGILSATLDNFGPKVIAAASWNLATANVFRVAGRLDEPGFLRLTLKAPGQTTFTWGVAVEPGKIEKGSPSPADFDAFWASARARLAKEVPLDPEMRKIPERCTKAFDFYRISFATFGRRVYGYMTVPTAEPPENGFPVLFEVNAAGCGGWTNDLTGKPGEVSVRFSVYPFEPHWNWREMGIQKLYDDMNAAYTAKEGVIYSQAGLCGRREDYFFYPVLLGIDRAVDWVAARPGVDRTRFRYQGTSQGGGFGFYLCGLNHTFTRAGFFVPAITDTMGYLKGRQSGWPQPVENHSKSPERRAAAERNAPYFDGANFASRIRCPVRVAVGFADTTCAPCAVYAAYNAIAVADKDICHGFGMGHGCRGEFYAKIGAWLHDDNPDILTPPLQRHTRLTGSIGKKADTFFYRRCWGPEGTGLVLPEAETAFTNPDDDVFNAPVGMWKGEFWGKLAISGARVAEYRGDRAYKDELLASARRLVACQRPDGYLGSYLDENFICAAPLAEARAALGWDCDFNWNLWCRKYTMWGLLAIYRATGARDVLDAAERLMVQQITMLRKRGVKLCDTGTTRMCGLPPCSVLKPLLLLYRETGNPLLLDYAREIVSCWDREGNPPPNFFRNAERDVPIFEWYAGEKLKPTKMYEMLSCLDGILEFYRVTGERRALDCVAKIAANIWKNERNALDSIGYNDNFANGARFVNGSTEPCDIVHWMRLNYDLYLLTGDVKYVDTIELAYLNAFQSAVFRDGAWGAREVRSHGRHVAMRGQSGFTRQHCCVNNLPRGFMDVALASATKEGDNAVRVNLYSPFITTFGDLTVSVTGDFPYDSRAVAKIDAKRPVKVRFRVPEWGGKPPTFRVLPKGSDRTASGRWFDLDVPAGVTAVRIDFDMSLRLVDGTVKNPVDEDEYRVRWRGYGGFPDMKELWRTETAARLYAGPLLLAKTRRWGAGREEVFRADMNGKGWKVLSAKRMEDPLVCAAYEVVFARGDERRTVRVCDFGSAGDEIQPLFADAFSIWF